MSESIESESAPSPKVDRKKWFIENVVSLGFALILVFMIRSSVIEAFKIPSGSMIPTLLIGDHIFVNKFAYGWKVPFTEWVGDKVPVYITENEGPQRGDIIVFKYPRDESFYYIKRVVGVPGDLVELKDKHVYVNSKPIDRRVIEGDELKGVLELVDDDQFIEEDLTVYSEKTKVREYTVMTDRKNFRSNFGPTVVPDDHYFVMGDNRDHSNDSRYWGFVPMKNVKGRAVVIWMSAWIDFDKWDLTFRPLRTGTILK